MRFHAAVLTALALLTAFTPSPELAPAPPEAPVVLASAEIGECFYVGGMRICKKVGA